MNDFSEFDPETDLSVPDRFGVYLWWPSEGTDWIHPEDVQLCEQLIPSPRIFQREIFDSTYNQLIYGSLKIRVEPTLWLEIETDGYLVGDTVEIRSGMGKRRPAIGKISDIFFNRRRRRIDYYLIINGNRRPSPLQLDEFQPAFELGKPMNVRQRRLADRFRLGG